MIFAAGLGTRLKPYTVSHPKALVPVGGKPMLQRVIENLSMAGVKDIVINVHHFADQVVDFIKSNGNFGLDIKISDESDCLLDTGGGLLKAASLLSGDNPDDPILLHNADILTDLPLGLMQSFHQQSGADVTLLCSHRDSSRTLYFIDNRLAGWENLSNGDRKPKGFVPEEAHDASPFGGVHIIKKRILFERLLDYAGRKIHPFSIMPFYLDNLSILDIRRFMLPDGCHWFDVGSTDKLAAAETYLKNK